MSGSTGVFIPKLPCIWEQLLNNQKESKGQTGCIKIALLSPLYSVLELKYVGIAAAYI